MSKWDVEYLKLCKKILTEGVEVENRTGINTIKIPNYEFNFDMQDEFPILQSKYVAWKSAIIEILWIWQMGSNKIQDLHDRGVKIWDEWCIDNDGIYRIYDPNPKSIYNPKKEVIVKDPLSVPIDDPFGDRHKFKAKIDESGNVLTAKSLIPGKNIIAAKFYGKELAGTIGKAYGYVNNRYGMMENTITKLRNNPNDRRKVNNLFQLEVMREAVLPPCVFENIWDVTNNKLNVTINQRSCDTAVGLPFNVTQYAVLLNMIAQITGYTPGNLRYVITDAHIYKNLINQVETQIKRYETYEELKNDRIENLLKLQKELQLKIAKMPEEDPDYDILDSTLKIIDIILDNTVPQLYLDSNIQEFKDFDNSKELKTSKILNYKHMGKIKMPVAQ